MRLPLQLFQETRIKTVLFWRILEKFMFDSLLKEVCGEHAHLQLEPTALE